MEPGSAYATTADAAIRERVAKCRRELRLYFTPLLPGLDRILARELPEARITSPCGACPGPAAVRSPLENFLMCYDLCGVCLEEANLVLSLARDRLSGRRSGEFLSPATISARIQAAQASEARKEEQRRVAREQGPLVAFKTNADGTITPTHTRPHPLPGRGEVERKTGTLGLPLALGQFSEHLIAWADLKHYLFSSGVRELPGSIRALRSAAPAPVFSKRGHRSLFRFGEAYRAAIGPARIADRVSLQATPGLKNCLRAPDHVPAWSKSPVSPSE